MIIRNSIKSVIRSPFKSILFLILITALVAALTLGSALAGMCVAMSRQCEETYTTIASLEYRGGRFPDKSVSDLTAAALRQQLDFEALSRLDGVKAVDRSNTVIVALPNFRLTLIKNSSAQNAVVLLVRKLETDSPLAKVIRVLYADSVVESGFINMYLDPIGGRRTSFEGEGGHYYLITGFTDGSIAGIIDVFLGSVSNLRAVKLGRAQTDYWLDVTNDTELVADAPEYQQFFDAALAYELINHSWYARITADPSFAEPFVENEYSLKQGRLYTPEDAAAGTYCLLPNDVADRWGVNAGDEVTLYLTQTGFSSVADSYWPTASDGGAGESGDSGAGYLELRCTVSGVISTTAQETPMIYISGLPAGYADGSSGANTNGADGNGSGGSTSAGLSGDNVTSDGFCGYTLGTLLLTNGISSEAVARIRAALPEGVDIALYDQGYAEITEALKKLREDAISVTLAAVLAAAAMLVLFGYVFVGRQSDTVVSMYLMGTPTRSLVVYVTMAAICVLVPAAITGCGLAFGLSGLLTRLITRSMEEGQSVLRMYSSSNLGVVNVIKADVAMPAWPGLAAGFGICVLGVAVCLIFLRTALKGIGAKAYAEKKKKKRAAENAQKREPRTFKPLKFSGAAVKYVVLSFLRGGVRSVAVPLVSALMAAFILVPATALNAYRRELDELNANTKISCYFTDYGGKRRYDLVLIETNVDAMQESEYFEDFHFSLCDAYAINRIFTRVDGASGYGIDTTSGASGDAASATPGDTGEVAPDAETPGETGEVAPDVETPGGTGEVAPDAEAPGGTNAAPYSIPGYEASQALGEVPNGGFSYENYLSNFLNGPKLFYTDDISSTPEFVGRASAELTWLEGWDESYFADHSRPFEGITGRGSSNMYYFTKDNRELCVVVSDDFLAQNGLALGDRLELYVSEDMVLENYLIIGSFRSVSSSGFIYTRRTNCFKVLYLQGSKQLATGSGVPVVKFRTSSSCGSFKLVDTAQIREAKQWLRSKGYSRVHTAGFYRLYPIFEDQEYCEAAEKIEKNIGYLEKVLPALAVLTTLTGFAAAYLLSFRRRVEIAALRSIGETSRRVFGIFTAEQLIPAALGTALGLLIWVLAAGTGGMLWLALCFLAGFAAGTLISVKKMSSNNLLEVLSDRE